jgi:hypothetical protein
MLACGGVSVDLAEIVFGDGLILVMLQVYKTVRV